MPGCVEAVRTTHVVYSCTLSIVLGILLSSSDSVGSGYRNQTSYKIRVAVRPLSVLRPRVWFVILAGIVSLFTGCATPQLVWNKTGAILDDFRRDRYDCVQQSRTSWAG